MKQYISNLLIALKAEHLKKKGTGIYYTSIIIGALSPILYFLFQLFSENKAEAGMPYNYYTTFIYDVITPFTFFLFPMIIIIHASKMAQLDHKNGGWQLMETQPIQKFSIYFSKYIVLLLSNLLSISSLFVTSLLCSFILKNTIEIPETANFSIEFYNLSNLFVRAFAASLFVTALQYFLSVLISSFIWSLLIGFFSLLATSFLTSFNLIPDWYPYGILNKISDYKEGSDIGNYLLYTEVISLFLSVFILTAGFYWYKNKNFIRAFIKPYSKIITSLSFTLLFVAIGYLILKPKQYEHLETTILCGKIESLSKFKNGYLIHPTISDTIASFKIINNEFKLKTDKPIALDGYKIIIDNSFPVGVIMASKDSIYVSIKYFNNEVTTKFTGTRLAENQYKSNNRDWSYVAYNLEQNELIDKPKEFFEILFKEWNKKYNNANSIKTRDNFIPKKDFIERETKLVCLEYLNYLNTYLDKRKAMFPKDKTELPSNIVAIKNKVKLNDESLISNESYLEYLKYELCKNDSRDIDVKLKEIENISKLKTSNFKNRLLYSYLKTNLEEASSSSERKELINNYSNFITDKKLKENLINQFKIYERLGRGNEARPIQAKDLNGNLVTISKFKGKFVAIDIWATWCGPCKYESPYFEKIAIKYKKENIVFLGLSSDQDTKKWYLDAKNKSKSVTHLRLENPVLFSKDFNVNSIPRFILIDPEGKIYNSNMPRPSDSAFEIIIRKALGLKELE
ncbi:redoxin family protein [Flavobacterium sp. LMO8]|uniref:redoxin family protein n=1 Tax=Flavobacterium sp. LMO8 TaxID=2654244 RepID=UPI001291FE32|nr:redoxin family protein [Flavobacterium sp. LMO8]MQP23632.1 redoxin family protein [Flavobacterium sp. LMO8]